MNIVSEKMRLGFLAALIAIMAIPAQALEFRYDFEHNGWTGETVAGVVTYTRSGQVFYNGNAWGNYTQELRRLTPSADGWVVETMITPIGSMRQYMLLRGRYSHQGGESTHTGSLISSYGMTWPALGEKDGHRYVGGLPSIIMDIPH